MPRSGILIILGIVLLLKPQPVRAADQAGALASGQPHEIGVLLLPALDATKDATNMQASRQSVIRHRQQAEFIARQFKMLGETLARKAAEVSPAVNLDKLSDRTAENLELLAKRAGADWVVHTAVEDVDASTDPEGGFLIKTRLLVQIWDAHRHEWLLNHRYTGQATGSGVPIMIFLRSLDTTTKESLAGILKAYPMVVTLEAEESLIDYLAGQTGPVIGDPAKRFQAPPAQ